MSLPNQATVNLLRDATENIASVFNLPVKPLPDKPAEDLTEHDLWDMIYNTLMVIVHINRIVNEQGSCKACSGILKETGRQEIVWQASKIKGIVCSTIDKALGIPPRKPKRYNQYNQGRGRYQQDYKNHAYRESRNIPSREVSETMELSERSGGSEPNE